MAGTSLVQRFEENNTPPHSASKYSKGINVLGPSSQQPLPHLAPSATSHRSKATTAIYWQEVQVHALAW